MDKRVIRNFAVESRKLLRKGVINKLAKLGITEEGVEEVTQIGNDTIDIPSSGERYTGKDVSSRIKLVDELKKREKQAKYDIAFDTLVEEVAYTWFNRIIAIRFMEVNNYLPGRQRILSSETAGKKEPDIITNLLETDLYAEFDSQTKDRVTELLSDGSAAAVDELYQLVFIKQCNSLNQQLPDLFERIDDYKELLFTISYIDDNDVIEKLLTIPESDFNVKQEGQIEIIGWMYQYYNSEPKNKVFARGGRKIRSDEIPAATQLFTPDWIVRYMVENSLGRYYIDQKMANPAETRTEKEIADEFGWKYYLPTAEQPEDVQLQIQDERKDKSVIALQELKLIDPSMGSGHILVYAFDVFMQLYEAEGESPRIAVDLILEKNLYGLDIDKRAFQLAYFALMMKGRQYSRRILANGIKPNVYAIPDNSGIGEAELQLLHMDFPDKEKAHQDLLQLINGFKDGTDLGSLIEFKGLDFENLKAGLDKAAVSFFDHAIGEMVHVGELLQQKYDIGITNPPYMGSSGMNKQLASFVNKFYPDSKSDLFGVFIERLVKMTKLSGYYALITQHAWMFLSSFEKLRMNINQQTIINMAHLGTRAFEEIGGEVVQTTTFVMSPKKHTNFVGSYLRLVDFTNHEIKSTKALKAIEAGNADYMYHTVQDNFAKIPGQPISYWVSENMINAFSYSIGKDYDVVAGITTGDNAYFLKLWAEVDFSNFGSKWSSISKGGDFRRWYGNLDFVIDYNQDSLLKMEKCPGFRHDGNRFYYKPMISWSKITSGKFSVRKYENTLFDSSAPAIIPYENQLLGFLNSKVASYMMGFINPTLNSPPGYVAKLPNPKKEKNMIINSLVINNIELSKNDWDSFESSWEFKKHSLI